MIAIPSLMFYRYFRGLVDAYTGRHGASGGSHGAAPASVRRAEADRGLIPWG
jgi:hypothetical protein